MRKNDSREDPLSDAAAREKMRRMLKQPPKSGRDSPVRGAEVATGGTATDQYQEERSIAIIGLTASGKSTYLLLLPKAMSQNRHWRLTPTGNTIRSSTRDLKRLLKDGMYPPATQRGTLREDIYRCIRTRPQKKKTNELILRIPDIAGAETDPAEETDFYRRYVRGSSGVMLIIDSTSPVERHWEYELFLYNVLLGELGQIADKLIGKSKFPVAIALTKCDEWIECKKNPKTGMRSVIERMPEIVGTTGAGYINSFRARKNVDLRVFGCSSTGFLRTKDGSYKRDNDGNCQPQKAEGNSLREPMHVFPEEIAEPFSWLLQRAAV